ncbi:uncharacterized protein Dvar_39810 [Desulfosarcina variabilis str. Montpellier]|uniref:hypothetical protein n=1 Tax=Desulfosarcina variabilis TaxID=2300 RepID=UPI003AFA9D45
MKNRKIIIVCGVNHSGTSCVAKLLIDNGADPGEYDATILENTPYVKYENIYFKNCCIEMAKIQSLVAPKNSIKKFVEYLKHEDSKQSKKPLVLKYPKSVYCLPELSQIIGKDRMRCVFVMRNTLDLVSSNVKKTKVNANIIFHYYNSTYTALTQYTGDVFITAFERIRVGLDQKMLLEYCGL